MLEPKKMKRRGYQIFEATHAESRIIRMAIEKVRKITKPDITKGRALEFICADFLSSK